MSNRIKPSAGRYDAPMTLKETAEYACCSWQHVQHLEVTALEKLIAGLKEKGISNLDFVDAFREGLLESEVFEDALILAVAEDLGLPIPTARFEGLGDTLRDLFTRAGYERRA